MSYYQTNVVSPNILHILQQSEAGNNNKHSESKKNLKHIFTYFLWKTNKNCISTLY